MRWGQAGHGLGQNSGKGADDDASTVATGASTGHAAVAVGRVAEFGPIRHRCGRHTGVAAHVAALAILDGRATDVIAGWRHDADLDVGVVLGRIGAAVALGAIGTGRRCIGVDFGNRGRCREVAMASRTLSASSHRNVRGRQGRRRKCERVAVAVGTFAVGGMRSGICHKERAGTGLRTGLEPLERCNFGDRVLAHAHPHVVGFVTGRATTARIRVNHRSRWRWQQKATVGTGRPGRHPWHQGTRSCMAAFTFGRRRQVRIDTCWRGRRHHHDAGDAVETAAGDVGAVTRIATAADAAVAELAACKSGHGAAGTRPRDRASWNAVDVAYIAGQAAQVGHVRRSQTAKCHEILHAGYQHASTMATRATRCDSTMVKRRLAKQIPVLHLHRWDVGAHTYVTTHAILAAHCNVRNRWTHERWHHGGHTVLRHVRRTVALCTVGACRRWAIRVNGRDRWHYRITSACMTSITSRSSWYVVRRLDDGAGIKVIADMTLRTVAAIHTRV